jgi:HEAT repeat protein
MWLEEALAELWTRVKRVRSGVWEADMERFGDEVQRFGGAAWQRIIARWPALAELVRERKIVSARYRGNHNGLRPMKPQTITPEPVLGSEAIEALIAQLLAASAWQARASAALSLGHVDAEGVVPALVRALRDPSVEVAVAAVDALAGREERAATDALLGVLADAERYFNPVTRVAAISGLARQLDVESFGPVFAAVRDIDAEVSIAAVAMIAERLPSAAATHLLPLLHDASGFYLPIVRLAAANALERAGCLHAGVVTELLGGEKDPAVRRVLERAQYLAAAT